MRLHHDKSPLIRTLGVLERSIGRAVDRLLPRELTQLRRVITAPQAVIAFKAREAVKDILTWP